MMNIKEIKQEIIGHLEKGALFLLSLTYCNNIKILSSEKVSDCINTNYFLKPLLADGFLKRALSPFFSAW